MSKFPLLGLSTLALQLARTFARPRAIPPPILWPLFKDCALLTSDSETTTVTSSSSSSSLFLSSNTFMSQSSATSSSDRNKFLKESVSLRDTEETDLKEELLLEAALKEELLIVGHLLSCARS